MSNFADYENMRESDSKNRRPFLMRRPHNDKAISVETPELAMLHSCQDVPKLQFLNGERRERHSFARNWRWLKAQVMSVWPRRSVRPIFC